MKKKTVVMTVVLPLGLLTSRRSSEYAEVCWLRYFQ